MTIFEIGNQIWTTKDGKKIRYRDLEDSHIINIAKKPFVEVIGDIHDGGEVNTVYFNEEMQLELLRRVVCKTLEINI